MFTIIVTPSNNHIAAYVCLFLYRVNKSIPTILFVELSTLTFMKFYRELL